MNLQFFKYQGAGNDFIMIDDREGTFFPDILSPLVINKLCHRRFGIGADGLIFIRKHENDAYDFEMKYFNSDGFEGTMCGNGGRCAVAFAQQLGIINQKTCFHAIDGEHKAEIVNPKQGIVSLEMADVKNVEIGDGYYYMDTGSRHYVKFVDDVDMFDVYNEGKKIRYNDRFRIEGTNVNFATFFGDIIKVRTYERGVEDETYACGTGSVAVAIAAYLQNLKKPKEIQARGGSLFVDYDLLDGNNFTNIRLRGNAIFVYKGEVGL